MFFRLNNTAHVFFQPIFVLNFSSQMLVSDKKFKAFERNFEPIYQNVIFMSVLIVIAIPPLNDSRALKAKVKLINRIPLFCLMNMM